MPRYFFDTHCERFARDLSGMEFADDKAARAEALHRAAWFASNVDNLVEPGMIVVTVRNANGDRVMTVRLACSIALG